MHLAEMFPEPTSWHPAHSRIWLQRLCSRPVCMRCGSPETLLRPSLPTTSSPGSSPFSAVAKVTQSGLAPDLHSLSREQRAAVLENFPEVRFALERLTAIRGVVTELQANGRLIGGPARPWGHATYHHAVNQIQRTGPQLFEYHDLARHHGEFNNVPPSNPDRFHE